MNIKELLQIQREFDARIEHKASITEYLLAIRTEMFELYNATEINKWWKAQRGKGNDRILDECADVMAFIFSCVNSYIKEEDFTHYPSICIFEKEKSVKFFEKFGLLWDWDYVSINAYILHGWLEYAISFTISVTGCNLSDIENAYKRKMLVNNQRQDSGY